MLRSEHAAFELAGIAREYLKSWYEVELILADRQPSKIPLQKRVSSLKSEYSRIGKRIDYLEKEVRHE